MVVIRVTTWYWIIWTPFLTSSRRALFGDGGNLVLGHLLPDGAELLGHLAADFLAAHVHKGGQMGQEMLWPPYWQEATWAMIWVAMLQAVEKLWGFSMRVPLMTVPFWSMSSRFTRSQLCMCWAK